jgi:serine/threonine protein kinase
MPPTKIAKTENSVIFKSRLDNRLVIIKKYNDKNFIIALDQVIKEINMLLKVRHVGIANLLEIWPEEALPSIVIEYGGVSLWEFAKGRTAHFRMVQFGEIFAQTFRTVDYLHKNKVIHRDLKTTNILIEMNTNIIPPKPIIKICDFGLARRTGGIMTPHTCTPNYRAPELLSGIYEDFESTYSEKIDMWSMACVIYEYLTCDILFTGKTDMELWGGVMRCLPAVENNPYGTMGLPLPGGKWQPLQSAFAKKLYGSVFYPVLPIIESLSKRLLSLTPADRPNAEECLTIVCQTFKLDYQVSIETIPQPVFLVRKTTRVDLDIRHVIVSNMVSMENYYEVTRKTISLAVDIFDKWLLMTDGSDDLILHSLAAAILASYSSVTILQPEEFASVYSEDIIVATVKNLFRTIGYNLDFMDMWSLMLDTARMHSLPMTDDHLDLYWHRVCELLLDYDQMFAKSQDEIRIILDKIIV